MFKVLSGELMNLVARGVNYGVGIGLSAYPGSVEARFPVSNLDDGSPGAPLKWTGALGYEYGANVPVNIVRGGDFEAGVNAAWEPSGAALTSESGAGNFYKGSKSVKLVNSAPAGGMRQRNIRVAAGEYLQLRAAAKSDAANDTYLVLTCLETNKSLNSAGAWTTAGSDCMRKTAATMAAFTPITFQAPTYSQLGQGTATLQIETRGTANGQTYYWDEILIVPGFNFCGVFGHNFPLRAVLNCFSSTEYWHAGGTWSTLFAAGAMAARVAWFYSPTMLFDPFLVVRFNAGSGTVVESQPYVGELVFGQAFELLTNPAFPVAVELQEPNVRTRTSAGSSWVATRGRWPLRRVTLSFAYQSDAEYQQARDLLFGMSRGGAYPVILLPTETDPDLCIYGRLEDSTTFRRDAFATRRAEFIIQEEALPWV